MYYDLWTTFYSYWVRKEAEKKFLLLPKKLCCPLEVSTSADMRRESDWRQGKRWSTSPATGMRQGLKQGSGRIMGYLMWGSDINIDLLILVVISGENLHSALNHSSPFKGVLGEPIVKAFELVASLLICTHDSNIWQLMIWQYELSSDQLLSHNDPKEDSWPFGWHVRTHLWKLVEAQAVADGWWKLSASRFMDARYWTILPGALTVCWEHLGSTLQSENCGLVCT